MEYSTTGECQSRSRRGMGVDSAGRWLSYVVLGLVFLAVCAVRVNRSPMGQGEVPASADLQVDQRLDPNMASWAELATLPGIGEVLAKRIVAYREGFPAADGEHISSGTAFSALEDLDAVRGIGPATLEKLKPFLRFPVVGQIDAPVDNATGPRLEYGP